MNRFAFDPHLAALSRGRDPMTKEQAQAEMNANQGPNPYFDYLHGRVMKVELHGDTLKTWLYDRDNGQGAALRALQPLLDAVATAAR